MSFLAIRKLDEESVLPEQGDNGVDVECPECGEPMRGRGPSKDGRARHFFHLSDTDCPGGESDIHRKQKSLAASALKSSITDYQRCELEVDLDVGETRTGVNTRRADVLLEFENEHQIFGCGIVVEVQYRNCNKNIPATTYDYLTKGYSVIWADQETFTNNRFLLDDVIVNFEKSEKTYRPDTTSPADLLPLDPPELVGTKYYFDERSGGPESPTMRSEDECEHRWEEQQEYCYQCFDCDARVVANPVLSTENERRGQQESEESEGYIDDGIGYVISLDKTVSFEELVEFQSRGRLIDIHGEDRSCTECGTEYKHVVGFDGVNLYTPSQLGENIMEKSYGSLKKVNGVWKRCCPSCGEINQYRFVISAELYYTSPKIDTIWIPEAIGHHRSF